MTFCIEVFKSLLVRLKKKVRETYFPQPTYDLPKLSNLNLKHFFSSLDCPFKDWRCLSFKQSYQVNLNKN